eukprot:600492_1
MAAEVPLKSVITETHKTWDVSSLISKLHVNANKEYYSSAFVLDDLSLKFHCSGNAQNRFIEIGLHVNRLDGVSNSEKTLPTDSREIHVAVHHSQKVLRFCKFAGEFPQWKGWGWSKRLTHSELLQHPQLQFHIQLISDRHPSFAKKQIKQTFTQQHEKMHQLSEIDGDVILEVKLIPQNDSNDLYCPPKKRRKLNDNKNTNSVEIVQGLGCHEIKYSSIILRSASKVFDRMLSTDMKEKQEKRIEIEAKSLDDVKDLTHFMSTNTLRDGSNALNMIELAHYYQMERLFRECVCRLVQNVSITNFVATIQVFDRYQVDEGYDKLVQFAKDNAQDLQNTDDFDKLHHSFQYIIKH